MLKTACISLVGKLTITYTSTGFLSQVHFVIKHFLSQSSDNTTVWKFAEHLQEWQGQFRVIGSVQEGVWNHAIFFDEPKALTNIFMLSNCDCTKR